MILSGIRYHILIKELGVQTSLKQSLLLSLAGQSMLITPGRVGNFIKCYIIKKKFGNPISTTSGSVITEQFLELISSTILLFFLIFDLGFMSL